MTEHDELRILRRLMNEWDSAFDSEQVKVARARVAALHRRLIRAMQETPEREYNDGVNGQR